MRPIQLALTAALLLAALALALAFVLGRVGASTAMESSSPAPVASDPATSAAETPLEREATRADSRTDLATRPASAPAPAATDRGRPGRSLFFRVLDEAGEPLAGALVRAIGQPGVQSLPTNSSGEGRLDGVLSAHRVLLVGAPERRILREPIGSGGQDPERPLVFVLPPGNRLELILRDVRGAPLTGVRVELSTDSRLFEGTEKWGPSSLHLSVSGTPFIEASWSKRGGQVTFRTEADGGVRLSGIRPNVLLRVVVPDVMRSIVFEEQFQGPGAGELLRRELVLDASLVELTGLVVNDRGKSLNTVRVELRREGLSVRVSTDVAGRFVFPERLISPSPFELWATHGGYAPLRLQDLVLGPGEGLPQLVLSSAPGFYLTLVDEDGNLVSLANLTAEVEGWPSFKGKFDASGRYRFRNLPPGRLSLRARVGPHTFEREFDPSQDEPTWELPTFGSLVVTVAQGLRPAGRSTAYFVRITSLDDPTLVADVGLNSKGSTSRFPLGPGMWSVQLQRRVGGGIWGILEPLGQVEPLGQMEPLGQSVEVEIHAGEPKLLDLD